MPYTHWQSHLSNIGLCSQASDLIPLIEDQPRLSILRPAAVLLPVVLREGGATVLLTCRSDLLEKHAGQIAFPGGKVEQADSSLVQAALRETLEETGITQNFIQPLGFLPSCKTSSGFCIFPLVAQLETGFRVVPDEGEVAEVFEVPLDFLMSPDNHHKRTLYWKGRSREVYEMPYRMKNGKVYNIWGVTAQIIRQLYENCYNSDIG